MYIRWVPYTWNSYKAIKSVVYTYVGAAHYVSHRSPLEIGSIYHELISLTEHCTPPKHRTHIQYAKHCTGVPPLNPNKWISNMPSHEYQYRMDNACLAKTNGVPLYMVHILFSTHTIKMVTAKEELEKWYPNYSVQSHKCSTRVGPPPYLDHNSVLPHTDGLTVDFFLQMRTISSNTSTNR